MSEPLKSEVLEAVSRGDERAFERVYDACHLQARLMAWRISHRPDWVDDMLNEAWCRAFRDRRGYHSDRPFLVWLAGILRNVYLEMCRRSIRTFGDMPPPDRSHSETPESIVEEAQVLAALNDCVSELPESEARIIRMRFFDNATLRTIAQEVSIPEATLREARLPAAIKRLRQCLAKKGLDISAAFPAQGGDKQQ